MIRTLVQLSDPHIKSPGSLAYGRVDTAAYLRRAVAAVQQLPQRPDAVLITGDLTDFGRPDEYAHLRALLQPLGACPLFLLPGNHDDRDALRRAFPEHAYLQAPTGAARRGDPAFVRDAQDVKNVQYVQYAADLGGMRLVVVDTVAPGASHGEVCAERASQLDCLLAEAPTTPTMIALHHPPFATFIGHMDEIGLLHGAELLHAVVARHPQVERVLCGHLHRPIQRRWAGTLVMTAPSTAHQVCLDLDPQAGSAFMMEPPAFLVHAWGDDGVVVSHQAVIGTFAGPFPFHEPGGALIN